MEIEVSEEISENLEKASKGLGLEERELVERAIKLYLSSIREYVELKEELEAWEKAGIEDLSDFEKRI